jgi:hypothetical protein
MDHAEPDRATVAAADTELLIYTFDLHGYVVIPDAMSAATVGVGEGWPFHPTPPL